MVDPYLDHIHIEILTVVAQGVISVLPYPSFYGVPELGSLFVYPNVRYTLSGCIAVHETWS